MARFHVYRLKQKDTFVVDLQADLLEALKTRIVAPLIPASDFGQPISRLNPRVTINGEVHAVAIHLMAAIAVHELGDLVMDLSDQRDEIAAVTDFAFQGF